MFETRVIRLAVLGCVAVGLMGLGAWLVLRPKTSAQALHQGIGYYEQGVQALKEKNGAAAQLHFQKASIRASNALERIDEEIKATPAATPEQVHEWTVISAKAFYLKARALRDEAFAKRMMDGKEVPETLDTSTGETFRSFQIIADQKLHNDAIIALRTAAMRLPNDQDLQNEAIRAEVLMEPIAWLFAEQFAKSLLKLDPKDTRARYLVARYEFEQPQLQKNAVTGPPTPPEKRSRSRVNEAMNHLAKLKEAKEYPLGRTIFLEAQIRRWLAADYERSGDNARADKERKALTVLLFDAKNGALEKAVSAEGLKNLSDWDVEGFLGAHVMAVELAAEEHQKKGPAPEKVQTTLNATIAYCQKLAQEKINERHADRLAATVAVALSSAQVALALEEGEEWGKSLNIGREVVNKAMAKETGAPGFVAVFSAVLLREAVLADKAGENKRAKDLQKEAMTLVNDALAQCEKRKLPTTPTLELHALAAEMKYAQGAKSQDIEPHLKALLESKQPNAESVAHLLRGVNQEREGRLEKAKEHFEQALKLGSADVKLRADMALATVYMGLGQPSNALASLQRLDKVYERLDELTPHERTWAQQFLRSEGDLAVLEATAHLGAAKQDLTNFVRENPKKPVPPGIFQENETAVENILLKLPLRKKPSLQVRQALIGYFASTGRLERAEKELLAALKDHPDSSVLLQLDIALVAKKAQDKAGGKLSQDDEKALTAKIDQRIQDFTRKFPEDRAAKMFWVSWLARSGRNHQALVYLKDPANFPGAKDDTYNRLMAIVLAASGNRQDTSKMLQQLPQDPLVDALLIQMAESNQAKQKSVQEAMARYESNGLFRVWNAELTYEDKDYAKAARDYFNALDFTRVKSLASAGLQRSLTALATDKPAEARKLAVEMLKDYPQEPALLLAYAIASLNLDDVGQPGDDWAKTKTMAGALNAWEQAVLKTNSSPLAVTMTRADFWLRSNHPDFARAEVLRALTQAPTDQSALLLAIRLVLVSPTKDHLAEARGHLKDLQKLDPEGAATLLSEARIDEAEGRTAPAIAVLTKLVEKHPRDDGAYASLVHLWTKQKQPAKAIQWSETWIEKMPDSLDAATNLVTQLAIATQLAKAKGKADEFTDARLKEIGKRLAERKFAKDEDPEKARKTILENERWLLRFRFAQAFLRAEELAEAEARLKALLKEKPDQTDALLTMADIHLKRKAWEKAAQIYQSVLGKEKDEIRAGNNLAWVLATELNEPRKALDVLRSVSKGRFSGKALPGDRLHPEVLDTLGTVYQKLQPADADLHREMAEVFEAGHKRYPRDGRMYFYLGLAYAGLDDNTKAAQLFQSALALAKDANNTGMTQSQRDMVLREAEAARKRLPVK